MATKTITISFQDRVWKMIHDQAAANGQSPAEYIREIILDKLQDNLDYEDAISNIRESDDKSVSRKGSEAATGLQHP